MTPDPLPNYSVRELNEAIGSLLERGFAPRFLVNASISKAQLKKGHLWLTLSDGKASIPAVVWGSQLQKLDFRPQEGDGVVIVGKLNFWAVRASLVVQVVNIRPTISTVLRQFEVVRELFLQEGLLNPLRRRKLPQYPLAIAILTSAPSSALADMLRTAKERWPLTRLVIIPIPVQGPVADRIQGVLKRLASCKEALAIEAIVLPRGGGRREDLMAFDDEALCRLLASFPVPVVTGLGHEDDMTVADLVADHRAATPTAAIVDLLPSCAMAKEHCLQRRHRFNDYFLNFLRSEQQRLKNRKNLLDIHSPLILIKKKRETILQKYRLLDALSPERWLFRGFSIVRDRSGNTIRSVQDLDEHSRLTIELSDGKIDSTIDKIYTN